MKRKLQNCYIFTGVLIVMSQIIVRVLEWKLDLPEDPGAQPIQDPVL